MALDATNLKELHFRGQEAQVFGTFRIVLEFYKNPKFGTLIKLGLKIARPNAKVHPKLTVGWFGRDGLLSAHPL
jgi:hypothetical protein